MIHSLQGRGVPGQFGLSQRSGNVSLLPSWTSYLSPVLVCAPVVGSSLEWNLPQQCMGAKSAWQKNRLQGCHECRIGVSVCCRQM